MLGVRHTDIAPLWCTLSLSHSLSLSGQPFTFLSTVCGTNWRRCWHTCRRVPAGLCVDNDDDDCTAARNGVSMMTPVAYETPYYFYVDLPLLTGGLRALGKHDDVRIHSHTRNLYRYTIEYTTIYYIYPIPECIGARNTAVEALSALPRWIFVKGIFARHSNAPCS